MKLFKKQDQALINPCLTLSNPIQSAYDWALHWV